MLEGGSSDEVETLRRSLAECREVLARTESERQQLSAIVEGSRDAIWSWTPDGIIVRWNAEAERLLGYTAQEIVGRNLLTLVPPERHEAAREIIGNLGQGAWYGQYETVRLHKDGSPLAVELTVSPLTGDDGKVVGGATVCRDITDRKHAQQSLATRMRELAALYRLTDTLQRAPTVTDVCEAALDAIVNALGCGRASILLLDDAGAMRFVAWRGLSESYRRAVDGHSPWTADSGDAAPIWVPDVADAEALESLQNTILAENIRGLAFIPLITDGQLIGKFMTYYATRHAFSVDETRLAVNIARQLAFSIGRKRADEARGAAEQSLRDSERRLELALSAGRMGAWEWNIGSNTVIWSPNLEKIHGLEPGTFSGRFEDFASDIHPDDVEGVMAQVQHALETCGDYHVAYRLKGFANAGRWLEAFGRVIVDRHGAPLKLTGVCMDVTDRKRAEERQEVLINELNHRVKNTLATVQAIAAQTLRGRHADPSVQEMLEARLIALSNAHSLLTERNWQGAEIRRIVAQALQPHAESERVSLQGPPICLPPKSAVAIAMGMHELATNAAKYGALSNECGRVQVSWTVDASMPLTLTLEWKEQGGPRVTEPTRRGFGTRLIERNLAYDLDGRAAIHFHPEGVVCTITSSIEMPDGTSP